MLIEMMSIKGGNAHSSAVGGVGAVMTTTLAVTGNLLNAHNASRPLKLFFNEGGETLFAFVGMISLL